MCLHRSHVFYYSQYGAHVYAVNDINEATYQEQHHIHLGYSGINYKLIFYQQFFFLYRSLQVDPVVYVKIIKIESFYMKVFF